MSEYTEPLTRQPLTTSSDPETRRRRTAHRYSSAHPDTQRAKRRSASSDRGGHYSSSSESNSGMVDTETNERHNQPSESMSSAQQEPVKKKRTRTLTTPQQSDALHALLAKSRFPSTAQREEVGRKIGLSARKVQIWFQNQRQKARRPKNLNTSSSVAVASSATQRSADSSLLPRTLSSGFGSDPSAVQLQPRASDLPFDFAESRHYLSGPGVPGPGLDIPLMAYRGSHEVGERRHPRTIDTSPRARPYPPYERYHSPSPTIPFQSYASTSGSSRMSRTLPPLIASSSGPKGRGLSRLSSFEASDSSFTPSRSISGSYGSHGFPTESPFAHTVVSPTFRPLVVPSHADWVPPTPTPIHPSLSATDSAVQPHIPAHADTALGGYRDIQEQPETQNPVQARPGRYDPVRGTVVPYSATASSPPTPPEADNSQ